MQVDIVDLCRLFAHCVVIGAHARVHHVGTPPRYHHRAYCVPRRVPRPGPPRHTKISRYTTTQLQNAQNLQTPQSGMCCHRLGYMEDARGAPT